MSCEVLLETALEGLTVHRGKVRDMYDLRDRLLMVATDRISAYDWVLPTGIPDKGRVLTALSRFWFEWLDVPNHMLATDLDEMDLPSEVDRGPLSGRTMLVRKTDVVPVECVVRGYLVGSGWRDYQKTGEVCGLRLPEGMRNCDQLPELIFTPATKATEGHDENISFEQMIGIVGKETAEELRSRSVDVYRRAADYALERGIVIADTKFEWGWYDGELLLIDEVLTPDSSRFWPKDQYQPGQSQPSFDKQFVRDWLDATDWDKNSTPPALPPEIVEQTRTKYLEAYEKLTGKPLGNA